MAAIIVVGATELVVGGILVLASTAGILSVVKKAFQKAQEQEDQQKRKKCYLCGMKTPINGFWQSLPEKSGKFKANKQFCFYKDMKWDGKRLECFKRTGHDCPHLGEACSNCGRFFGNPKAHKHPKGCPYK